MAKNKRLTAAQAQVDRSKNYALDEAIKLIKSLSKAKFDETVEMSMNLGIDPRHADQAVRGMIELPNGTGKSVRVAVFARGPKADEAKAAGADIRMVYSPTDALRIARENPTKEVVFFAIGFETTTPPTAPTCLG